MKKIILAILFLSLTFFNCKTTDTNENKDTTVKGFFYYENHTYISVSRKVNWHIAKKLCENVGGHLVIIEDEKENDFIRKIISSGSWIGLSDHEKEGDFKWING